ncbi:MAG TPA: hypothetical protein PK515_01890 [Candidatus Cloacimonas sp.]|jgi:hypothetical protein|nr:hypothetical protein [Candidatus Cloacimonas sp.]
MLENTISTMKMANLSVIEHICLAVYASTKYGLVGINKPNTVVSLKVNWNWLMLFNVSFSLSPNKSSLLEGE